MNRSINVGTCSWTDPSLIKCGRFYPRLTMSAEERLRFYAEHFPMVEVDSSYYALPARRMVELQVERTPADFVLHYKAFGTLTGHHVDPSRLPRAVKDMLSVDVMAKKRIAPKEMPAEARELCAAMFASAVEPARDSGKLGLLLFQFPPWLMRSEEAEESILRTASRFTPHGLRIAVEFRHGSWMDAKSADETLSFLDRNDLIYVSVDEPQFESGATVPPRVEVTGGRAYIRFHGRNRETWFKKVSTAAERFKYLYSEEELEDWSRRLAIPGVPHIDILFNNNWEDYSVKNALVMKSLMGAT